MSYARTSVSTTAAVSATVEFLALDGFMYAAGPPNYLNPTVVGISTPAGGADYRVTQQSDMSDYPAVRIHVFVDATLSGFGSPEPTGSVEVGEVYGPVYWSPPCSWTGDTEAALDFSGALSPLHLYKMRDASAKPEDLANVCHPSHLAMRYQWAADPCTRTVDAGPVSDSVIGAFGPTDDIGAVSFSVGLARTPQYETPPGAIARIKDARIHCGAETFDIDFSGFYDAASGCHAEGDGGELTLYLDSWSAVPLSGAVFVAMIWWPTIVDYDLVGYDWRAVMPVQFDIESDLDSGLRTVTGSFRERLVCWKRSWAPESSRAFVIAPRINVAWAEAEDEMADPPDLACTLEESGLSMAPDFDWPHFRVHRIPRISVQLPPGCTEPPSEWIASDSGVIVTQEGAATRVDIQPGTVGAAVRRVLREDAFSHYLTPDGLAEFGLPGAYRNLSRRPGGDVWSFENYAFLALEYESELAQTLTLTLEYSHVSVHDNHLTGQERIDGFSYTRTPDTVSFSVPVRQTAPGEAQTLVIDLAVPACRKLQHVDAMSLSGFANGGEESMRFTLRDLRLTEYNPIDRAEAGRSRCKVTFNRPAEDGTPISYTGLTCDNDGAPCCRPPDQANTRCGEEGLDFVERVIGAGSGLVLDFMRPLSAWLTEWSRQEGFSAPNTGQTEPGSVEYDSAFVDADGNDMLAETLFTGDLCEVIDKAIGTSLTSLRARPRVGRLHIATGYPFPCVVRKILHGGVHGLARSGGGRSGPGRQVGLYEVTPVGIRQVDEMSTDDWSRFSPFRGVREVQAGGIDFAASVSATETPAAALYNTLWQWLEAQVVSGRLDALGSFDDEIITVVYTLGAGIARQTTYDGGRHWTEPEVIVTRGMSPSVFAGLCDGDAFWLAFERDGDVWLRTPDGSESVLAPGHTAPVAHASAHGETGRAHLLAHSGGWLWHLPLVHDGSTYIATLGHAVALAPATATPADCLAGPHGYLYAFYVDPAGALQALETTDQGRTFRAVDGPVTLPLGLSQPAMMHTWHSQVGRAAVLYSTGGRLWFTMLYQTTAGWHEAVGPGREDLGEVGPAGGDMHQLSTGELLALYLDPLDQLAMLTSRDHGRTFA